MNGPPWTIRMNGWTVQFANGFLTIILEATYPLVPMVPYSFNVRMMLWCFSWLGTHESSLPPSSAHFTSNQEISRVSNSTSQASDNSIRSCTFSDGFQSMWVNFGTLGIIHLGHIQTGQKHLNLNFCVKLIATCLVQCGSNLHKNSMSISKQAHSARHLVQKAGKNGSQGLPGAFDTL